MAKKETMAIRDKGSRKSAQPKEQRRNKDSGNTNRQASVGEQRLQVKSASDLGISWIGDFCPDGRPHHLIGIHDLDGGSIFKCNNCSQHIWLPAGTKIAAELDSLIDRLGPQEGYCKFLDKHRPAKIMVAKLQDLWRAKQESPNNGEFLLQVLDIMKDGDYDRISG